MSTNKTPLSLASKIALLSYFGFWDRFIYYGAFTLLILYLTNVEHLSEYTAYGIWGIFAVLGFTTPVLGGIIGDKWLKKEQAIILGTVGLFVGSVIMILFKANGFFLGISCILCGMGLLKTNLATYVGELSNQAHSSSNVSYNYYFVGMVLGAMSGPAVFGVFVKHHLWYSGFAVTALGTLSSIFIGMFLLKLKPFVRKDPIWKQPSILLAFCFAFSLVYLLFKYSNEGQIILGTLITAILIYLAFICLKATRKERVNVIYLLCLSAFCLAHLLASFQTDGAFTSFIQNHLNHTILGWSVPTLEFSSIEPMSAVIFSPILGYLWVSLESKRSLIISPQLKLLLGTTCSAIAFLLILHASSSSSVARQFGTVWYLISANTLIGIGDALIIPTMMSAVNTYSPNGLKGTLMGVWFMADALAGLLAGLIAKPDQAKSSLMTTLNFHHSFMVIFIILATTAIFIAIASPWLKRFLKT